MSVQQLLRWLTCLALALSVAACGGGGDASTPATVASRVEAGPAAVLLTSVGASRALSARLLDAAGAPVPGAISWSSSDPAAVAVDASGNVRALVAAGSARVTASSGALPSATVLVTIAQPVAGAQLLADSQIVAGPTPIDTNADPSVGNPYEVLLRGVPTLAVGSLVIASESANVAGRVLSAQPEGGDQRVRLVTVPPTQLFTAFAFRDTIDLGSLGLVIPDEIAARYDVVQNGRTYVFTPRPGVTHERERPTALGETPPPPPFSKCERVPDFAEGTGLPLPLALSIPPTFEVTVDGSVLREATSAGTRITLTGQPKFKLSSVIEIRAAFEGKITCKLTVGRTPPFRAPGWASALGGEVEFGAGFEVGGKLTVASAKLGAAVKLDTAMNAVLDCPAAPALCSLTGTATGESTFEPQFTAPALEQAQVEATLSLFGFASLDLGSADFQALQLNAIEVKMGPEFSGALTAEALQIANLDADTGRSKYALAFKSEVGPGVKLGTILAALGASEAAPLKLAFSGDLGGSPKSTSVVADRARYLPGERANVVVKLDTASTRFPQELLYNVERVELRRNSGLFGTEVLAQQNASEGQTDFELAFDSPGLIDVGEIFAFVFTKALPFLPVSFELAAATAAVAAPAPIIHNGLTIARRSDILINENGSLTTLAPFDDEIRIKDDNSSPPFVGALSSTVSMPPGLSLSGSLTLTAASEVDSVTTDPATGAIAVTMGGRAACNFALQAEPTEARRVAAGGLTGEYSAGKGVVIGPRGGTVVISASISVSHFELGGANAKARIGIQHEGGLPFEEFEIRDSNVAVQPPTVFNRTVVMPAGGGVNIDLDASVFCSFDRGLALSQSHAAEATFTIAVQPN